MHELTVVKGIVDIADREVKKASAETVEKIQLTIGELAGIEWEAFQFAWPEGVKGSVLEHAECAIDRVPGFAHCQECDHDFPVEQSFAQCPVCQSYFIEILRGKELRVNSLVVH